MPILQLGDFQFSMSSLALQEIDFSISANFEKTARIGAKPAVQALGVLDETISLPFLIYPGKIGEGKSLAILKQMQKLQSAHLLVLGSGEILGNFIIEKINFKKSHLLKNGMAMKIDGTIELSAV